MSFVAELFGGRTPQQVVQMQQPQVAPPTPAPPAPARSDSEIQQAAIEQRKRYGYGGGRSITAATGGMGVPTGSTYSAVTALLGGGSG